MQIRSRMKTDLLFYSDTSIVSYYRLIKRNFSKYRHGGGRAGVLKEALQGSRLAPKARRRDLHDLEGASRDGQDLQVSDLRLGDVALKIPARAPVSQADGFPCRAEQRRGLRYPAGAEIILALNSCLWFLKDKSEVRNWNRH